ncbi:MAG: GNAT family N-acetyltransferase [Clostridia bacterium]|nr:GNAT family N-acetyltransferase [Clostridia bacterium]
MIRLAEDLAALSHLCADSPFGCQILSAANAYGLHRPFAQFWTDETAAYSKLDGVMRICGTITDSEEAAAFLRAVGAESVVCTPENAAALGLTILAQGVVLVKDLPPATEAGHTEVPLRQVYDVLKSCDMVGDFEPFYLDLSHRVRHGTAACRCEHPQGQAAAVSIAVYGEACSLITAVAVRPEFQRQGLGTKVLRALENRLSGRVYLLRAEDKNERFYASMGYKPCGAWCAARI